MQSALTFIVSSSEDIILFSVEDLTYASIMKININDIKVKVVIIKNITEKALQNLFF